MKKDDDLSKWVDEIDCSLILDRRKDEVIKNYGEILRYLQNSEYYKEQALSSWSKSKMADPWLIAVAFTYGYTVITFEKPNKELNSSNKSRKAKVPDVCDVFSVPCNDLFYMLKKLSIKM